MPKGTSEIKSIGTAKPTPQGIAFELRKNTKSRFPVKGKERSRTTSLRTPTREV